MKTKTLIETLNSLNSLAYEWYLAEPKRLHPDRADDIWQDPNSGLMDIWIRTSGAGACVSIVVADARRLACETYAKRLEGNPLVRTRHGWRDPRKLIGPRLACGSFTIVK